MNNNKLIILVILIIIGVGLTYLYFDYNEKYHQNDNLIEEYTDIDVTKSVVNDLLEEQDIVKQNVSDLQEDVDSNKGNFD